METINVLVVDDDKEIVNAICKLLESEGYKTLKAYDGLEAIDILTQNTVHLIILDIMMPKIDGYTVCEMIRKQSNVPIIMLTALDEEEAQIKAFELKVDDYIIKPFSIKLVLMRVEAVLRRVKEQKSYQSKSILTCGNIQLDRTSYSVYVNYKPVLLTHTEYKLMELFMQNPGRVFTRDNLLNLVWGYDFIGDEKTVNIHIMNLRRKLDTDMIETIRGVGYRLDKEN